MAKKKFDIIQKRAAQGDKKAIDVLHDWEKSVEKERLGPAARTKDWIIATRKSILEEAMSDKSKLPNNVIGWYKQEKSRIINDLQKSARDADTKKQHTLEDQNLLADYLVENMREPPGYDLGHQLGDKLGDKPGRLEFTADNHGRGSKHRL